VKDNTETLLALGVVLGGAYVLYNIMQGAKALGQGVANVGAAAARAAQAVGNAGVNAVSGGIAQAYLAATLPPSINPSGNVSLQPGSQIVSMSTIPGGVSFDSLSDSAVFDYMDSQYLISGSLDVHGNYIAQLVGPSTSAFGSSMPTW
jgi:hypothetical protein